MQDFSWPVCASRPARSRVHARMPLNALCKCCRQSRTKCDMIQPDGPVRECSRCKRLGLLCIPEEDRRKLGKGRSKGDGGALLAHHRGAGRGAASD